jgi:hypothetical protein
MHQYNIEQREMRSVPRGLMISPDKHKPYFVWQGLACHGDGGCGKKHAWTACAASLATKMVRRGLPDGMMCTRTHDFQSIYRLAEYERSPKLWLFCDVELIQKWIKEYGEKGIILKYTAHKVRWNTRYRRDYYVSFADDGARFAFWMIWHGNPPHSLFISWPKDWQLDSLPVGDV